MHLQFLNSSSLCSKFLFLKPSFFFSCNTRYFLSFKYEILTSKWIHSFKSTGWFMNIDAQQCTTDVGKTLNTTTKENETSPNDGRMNCYQFSSAAQSCPTLCDPMGYELLYYPWNRVYENYLVTWKVFYDTVLAWKGKMQKLCDSSICAYIYIYAFRYIFIFILYISTYIYIKQDLSGLFCFKIFIFLSYMLLYYIQSVII